MPYLVMREGQTYGPYSLEELNSYVASGNVSVTDMAAQEGMTGWVPVSSLIGVLPSPVMSVSPPLGLPPVYPSPTAVDRRFESAPNLHWGLLLLLIVVSFGSFLLVWYIVLALWSRRIEPHHDAPYWYYGSATLQLLQLGTMVVAGSGSAPYVGITLLTAVIQIVTRFRMRSLLEEHYTTVEPIGLTLSGVMTFFFGEIYFQYHFNRINRLKRYPGYL